MHLVSFSDLKKLASSEESITEDDTNSVSNFSYSDFVDQYRKTRIKLKLANVDNSSIDKVTYNTISRWLSKHCPPIVLVGEGSSRTAYACADGKCLKVASNKTGIALNKTELKNVGVGKSKYSCFTCNYAYDDKTYGSILTECCAKLDMASSTAIDKIYGVRDAQFIIAELFEFMSDCRFSIEDCLKQLVNLKPGIRDEYSPEEIRDMIKLLQGMIGKPKDPQFATLNSLVLFYLDNGADDHMLLVNDLFTALNWGVGLRDGMTVLLVIDAGFSSAVAKSHY